MGGVVVVGGGTDAAIGTGRCRGWTSGGWVWVNGATDNAAFRDPFGDHSRTDADRDAANTDTDCDVANTDTDCDVGNPDPDGDVLAAVQRSSPPGR